MKRIQTIIIPIVCIVLIMGGVTYYVWGNNSTTTEIQSLIHQFYHHMRSGEYEKAIKHVKVGGTGYMPDGGLLIELSTDEARDGFIQGFAERHKKGYRLNLNPQHIQVFELDSGYTAVAVYYVTGHVTTEEGKQESARGRSSLFLVKEDGQWKFFHWHSSFIKAGSYATP